MASELTVASTSATAHHEAERQQLGDQWRSLTRAATGVAVLT